MKENVIVPTKEEVIKLLIVAINDNIIHIDTVGGLLGMKWVDSLLPEIKGAPDWGYEGLKAFFLNHSIEFSCSLEEALEKLTS